MQIFSLPTQQTIFNINVNLNKRLIKYNYKKIQQIYNVM